MHKAIFNQNAKGLINVKWGKFMMLKLSNCETLMV
jgi:hypothetical protein